MNELVDRVWHGGGDAWTWVRGVIVGEWDDQRSLGQIVADAVAGFVPGLGSVITLRDLLAVLFRLARHPERRAQVDEWILLIAMLLPLAVTVLGTAVAGVGALVGAEIGGFLRALALMLVAKGGVALRSLVEFFQHHGYGDVVAVLRTIRFAEYRDAVTRALAQQIGRLERLIVSMRTRIEALAPESLPDWLPGRDAAVAAIRNCERGLAALDDLRTAAVDMIPKALIEMDQRLAALLAGDVRTATRVTHQIAIGTKAPVASRAQSYSATSHAPANAHTTGDPEPGNTRRIPERRLISLSGVREYSVVDPAGRPVGAVPYKEGDRLAYPPLKLSDWDANSAMVDQGFPDLAARNPSQLSTRNSDYAAFSRLRPSVLPAGSKETIQRLVSHDDLEQDVGAYCVRVLPPNGESMRADLALKEVWNRNGEFVEIEVPPQGHFVWREIHALQVQAAGHDVPYSEALKVWEGPAASQPYFVISGDGGRVADHWMLPGGGNQIFLDRSQVALLKRRGFMSGRRATGYKDFDGAIGTIVPGVGPAFEVVALSETMPFPSRSLDK